ncbi:sensor histidine kinase [Motilibacter rhizosphaerae]|uniref:sensor histidine kinase n=1 Tax=Motilibacter rhizosphaerae TaxID=598652 RepID=UPI00102C13A9|nr:ATP-binding protein [Motilibacter rhizosphaerae]
MAWYPGRRGGERGALVARPRDVVPEGVVDVLSVLRASTVLVGPSDDVLRASPTAYAFGLVRDDRLASPELLALVRSVRRDGEIRQQDLELPRGPLGGEKLAVTARVAPLDSGRLVLVLVEDRTESRRIDAVRRDFVANVSHELKTPVGALSLLAEAVVGASDDPDAVRHFARSMHREAGRLADLVQELIDLSRLQGHDPLAAATPVDVDEVVVEAIDRCSLAAGAKGIVVVSGGQDGLQVIGDEGQLVMAVRNLVDNAISYSPPHTRVAVGVRRLDGLVEISVTDQGIGIPEGDLERIFERFYRVDPARSRETGGTGLGLSIVKHIAQNHGGEVVVWSVEGSGSTFTVRLPRAPGSGEEALDDGFDDDDIDDDDIDDDVDDLDDDDDVDGERDERDRVPPSPGPTGADQSTHAPSAEAGTPTPQEAP